VAFGQVEDVGQSVSQHVSGQPVVDCGCGPSACGVCNHHDPSFGVGNRGGEASAAYDEDRVGGAMRVSTPAPGRWVRSGRTGPATGSWWLVLGMLAPAGNEGQSTVSWRRRMG
jgi:hypothetical protein